MFLQSVAYAASAVPLSSDFSKERQYPRFIKFPDGNDVMQDVDLEVEPDMEILAEVTRNPARNRYLLYTR